MFWSQQYLIEHAIAVAAACALLAAAHLWPRVARILYLALFAWACSVNWRTAVERPEAYLEYADLAVLGVYAAFIRGFFASHVLEIVGTIATCQGLIAAGLVAGGRPSRVALIGAIVFLVMIAPLGVGSGFPSTVIMAAGCIRLLLTPGALDRSLPAEWRSAVAGRTARTASTGGGVHEP